MAFSVFWKHFVPVQALRCCCGGSTRDLLLLLPFLFQIPAVSSLFSKGEIRYQLPSKLSVPHGRAVPALGPPWSVEEERADGRQEGKEVDVQATKDNISAVKSQVGFICFLKDRRDRAFLKWREECSSH